MAYKDYVQIYNVMDSAGITEDDDRATQVTKIADWINTAFSDIVTAETFIATGDTATTVRVFDKVVKAGFSWGTISGSSYVNSRQPLICVNNVYKTAFDISNTSFKENDCLINDLGLFVCMTSSGYIMDFINMRSTTYSSQPRFMVVNATDINGDTKKLCCTASYSLNTGTNGRKNFWWTISEGCVSCSLSQYVQEDYLGRRNTISSRTLLTKFMPMFEDLVCDTLYKMDGLMPPCKSVFELNGNTYLSLNYYDYGAGCGLALKLD